MKKKFSLKFRNEYGWCRITVEACAYKHECVSVEAIAEDAISHLNYFDKQRVRDEFYNFEVKQISKDIRKLSVTNETT